MKLFSSTVKEKRTGVKIEKDKLFNYSDLESRESTIRFLFSYSKTSRTTLEEYWRTMKRYYDEEHDTVKQMAEFVESQGLPWKPSQCTDGFIHVETQIDPQVPEFEFSGRDDDLDSAKAKERENVVRFVLDNNPMENMNTRNERRMNVFGLAAWKVAFDFSIKKPNIMGDIRIGNPHCKQLLWDSSATENIDDGEYFGLVYRLHKMAAARVYAKDLKRVGKTINDFAEGYGLEDTEFLQEIDSSTYDNPDYTVQITEWYFKQPEAGSIKIDDVEYKWEAGDIGLVILINQEEIRYNPKYWRKTNCNMYPVSVYCKVPNDNNICGKSEIEMIKPLIDSADRQLSYAQLNDAFTANDIIITRENDFADDFEPQNVPAAIWKLKASAVTEPKRLGGLSAQHRSLYETADKFKEMMQQTNGNFDAFQGNEPSRVTTATGIAILNDRSRSRQDVKKIDRTAGFERLIKLIDFTALEFYDDNRTIYIGAKSKEEQPISFPYNSNNMRVFDDSTQEYYYPVVDVKVHIGDGLKNSKAFTSQALQELSKMQVTPQNYKFVKAYIDTIDIPQKVELNKFIDEIVQQQMQPQQPGQGIPIQQILEQGGFTPEELDILEQNPEIAHKAAQQNGLNIV